MNYLRLMLFTTVAALSLTAYGADYPYCTNGSNTGNGYGWDPAVTDPNGSHSCLSQSGQPAPAPAPAPGGIPGGGNSCWSATYTCTYATVSCRATAPDIYHIASCYSNAWANIAEVKCIVTDAYGHITSQFSDYCYNP